MHKFVVLGSAIALPIVLQGCGGSHKSCVNSDFKLVSQSFSATSTVDMHISVSGPDVPSPSAIPTQEFKTTFKLDVEKMNVYAKSATQSSNETLQFMFIFDSGKKQMVEKHDITMSFPGNTNYTDKNCTIKRISTLPDPEVLSQCFQTATAFLSQKMTCTGNDGTYDQWELNMKIPDSSTPLPPMPPPLQNVTEDMHYSWYVNKDRLFHKAITEVESSTPSPSQSGTIVEKIQGTTNVDSGVAAAGGPSAEDLDYSSWGECHELEFDSRDFHTLSYVPSHEGALQFQHVKSSWALQSLLNTITLCSNPSIKAGAASTHAVVV